MTAEKNSTPSLEELAQLPNNNETLAQAYSVIFGHEASPEMSGWQVAQAIIDNWDGRNMSQELLEDTLFNIICHTNYPSTEITQQIVSVAEEKATEVFPELDYSVRDPHMAVVEYLEKVYKQRRQEKLTE